ncbi:MAG: DUF58 domain-containing protein [Bacteriovoracaceae bacterium]
MKPTRLGYYLLGLNFILFLLALGYSNNLLFLFSLILIAQTLYWLAETYRFHHGVIRNLKVSSCFAGELTAISFDYDYHNFKTIKVTIGNRVYKIKDFVINENKVLVSLLLPQRGKYHISNLAIYDSRPFGLFAKTVRLKEETSFYVYPKLLKDVGIDLIAHSPVDSGPLDSNIKGEEDFLGLISYQGEDFKKINWKQFARTDDLYIKQGLSPLLPYLHFVVKDGANEEELSVISSKLVVAHKHQYSFSLMLKDQLIQQDSGKSHLQYCLERLSEC